MPVQKYKKFILASASPRRKILLEQIGIIPDLVLSSGIDETPLLNEMPSELALRLAKAKAKKVSENNKGLILAADTIVTLGNRILGKARNIEEAQNFLSLLSGRRHQVLTALAFECGLKKPLTRIVKTSVSFKRLTQSDISNYLTSGEWVGKAGGYAIQGFAGRFVKKINGSYTNVVGLPLFETANLIEGIGFKISNGEKNV